jgi:hypothetical protein
VSGPGQPFESGFGAGGDYFELYASPTQPLSTGSLTFTVRNTQVVPEITVDVVGATPTHLHPLIQRDGTGMVGAETRLDGTRTVRLTAAGGKVAGAFALVDVDDSTDLASTVAEVARAGAVGYVVYSSTSPGIRPPRPGSRTAVPGIELSKTEGIALARTLAHGDVRLSLVGTSRSPRVYDLERTWSGQIPQRPWTTYRTRDLARIDEVYRTLGKPGAAAVEATVDATSGGIAFPVPVGGSRVHYVSADVAWSHALLYGGDADDGGLWPAVAWVEPLIAYPAGRTTPKAWATPVIRPSADNQNDYNDLCRRAGDDAVIVVSPWGDGQGRYNDLSDGEFAWTLGSGGKTLASGDGPWIRATLPTARATYTLDFTGRATDPTWGLSTSTHSRWVFPSAHTDPKQPQPLPLLNLDTVLPLNAANTVPAGRPMTFTVNSRMPVGVSPLTVRALTVETSADGGRTWTPARSVARADQDTFTVTVTNPAQPGPVALRLSAVADGGIGVLQEVIAAYRVT